MSILEKLKYKFEADIPLEVVSGSLTDEGITEILDFIQMSKLQKMNDLQKDLNTSDVSNLNINAIQTLDIRRFYRKKYHLALQMYAIVDINEYAKTQPTWFAKDILAAIIKDYDPQLPSDILLEMTQFILKEWEKVQLSKKRIALS